MHFLVLAAVLFTLGVFGIFINRKNVITLLMSLELMLLAVNLNLVSFSAYLSDISGQIFAMFVLTVAAAEIAIGLAILVAFTRGRESIEIDKINIKDLDIIDNWKKKSYKIGVTNGCFDLLHRGHKFSINQAKYFCDRLIVLINSDKSINIAVLLSISYSNKAKGSV